MKHSSPNTGNRFFLLTIASAALLMVSLGVAAATQGEPGQTSEGDLLIELNIPKLIRITDLQDIPLGTYDGNSTDRSGTSNACVRGNGNFTYQVTASSANGTSDFILRDDGTTDITYDVSWGGSALTHETALTGQALDSNTLGSCSGGADRIAVTVPAAQMDAAVPGNYTDTLTLLVEPE